MKSFRLLSWIVGGAVALPLPVLASEEAKAGLPQMDVSLFAGQLFWLVVCFVVLYVLMKRNILPRIERTQDKRQKKIQGDLAEASAASDEAHARQAEYEKELLEARRKAETMVETIVAEAEKVAHARQTEQQKELDRHLSDTEAKIGKMRETALKESQAAAEDLAREIVKKVAGGKA